MKKSSFSAQMVNRTPCAGNQPPQEYHQRVSFEGVMRTLLV